MFCSSNVKQIILRILQNDRVYFEIIIKTFISNSFIRSSKIWSFKHYERTTTNKITLNQGIEIFSQNFAPLCIAKNIEELSIQAETVRPRQKILPIRRVGLVGWISVSLPRILRHEGAFPIIAAKGVCNFAGLCWDRS